MDPRKQQVLNAIINHFLETAEPVGSKTVFLSYHLSISPATIRNEMILLEKEGLIYQPHTSAGRVPTELGYRLYVDEIADYQKSRKKARTILAKMKKISALRQAKQRVYDTVALLAQISSCASFATVPESKRTFYLGISNILRQPEFLIHPWEACQVIEVLEKSDHFIKTLKRLRVDDLVKVFIGKENLIKEIESCSLIAATYHYQASPACRRGRPAFRTGRPACLPDGRHGRSGRPIGGQGYQGFIGLLGPTRMNYPFNITVLQEVKKMLLE